MVEVRAAVEDDLGAINDLYNELIPTTTTSWTESPMSIDDRRSWFAARSAGGDAVLVAVEDGVVVGFAAYGPFRDNEKWPGYRFTAELTIFVDGARHGRGVGRLLMEGLVSAARSAGLHVLVAAVDADTPGSLAFHRAMGFEEVARMPEVGFKFGRWLDLVLLQRRV